MSVNSVRQNLEATKNWIRFMEYKYPNYKSRRKKAKKLAKVRKKYGVED